MDGLRGPNGMTQCYQGAKPRPGRCRRVEPRSALNLIAYAHLVLVVDGGIIVSRTKRSRMRGADWRAEIASQGARVSSASASTTPVSYRWNERAASATDLHRTARR